MFDYQKIIKSRSLRVKLLKLLNWIPDKAMVKLQYRIKFGRKLNLVNPERFTDKLQWYKIYYHDPQMTQCAGKHDVRQYVKDKGCEKYLNEEYGVYTKADEIDFTTLPDRFVVKGTKGAASQQVYICMDKRAINEKELRQKFSSWISNTPNKPKKNPGREWAYNSVREEIVIEKYIDSSDCPNGLLCYKIFCFNGKAKFLYVISDIKDGYFNADYGIYDLSFNKMPYSRVGAEHLELVQGKPDNFDEMIEVAEKLSEGFPHVRVDLFNINGNIIFGEMTFYNDSGYMKYEPDEYDMIAGEYFTLPEKRI